MKAIPAFRSSPTPASALAVTAAKKAIVPKVSHSTGSLSATNQTASIAATNLANAAETGFYIVYFYFVSVVSVGGPPTVQPTTQWNDGVAAQSVTQPAIALATSQAGETYQIIRHTGNGPIQVSIAVVGAITFNVYVQLIKLA